MVFGTLSPCLNPLSVSTAPLPPQTPNSKQLKKPEAANLSFLQTSERKKTAPGSLKPVLAWILQDFSHIIYN